MLLTLTLVIVALVVLVLAGSLALVAVALVDARRSVTAVADALEATARNTAPLEQKLVTINGALSALAGGLDGADRHLGRAARARRCAAGRTADLAESRGRLAHAPVRLRRDERHRPRDASRAGAVGVDRDADARPHGREEPGVAPACGGRARRADAQYAARPPRRAEPQRVDDGPRARAGRLPA